MYKPNSILSENTKTLCSINLPIKDHCRPTKHCAFDCYARTGRIAFPASQRKYRWVSDYLKQDNINELIEECRSKTAVRLSGSGDLLLEHVSNILKLAKELPNTIFWGMTRKLEISYALNDKYPNLKMLVSLDGSSPKEIKNYKGKLCFGPRRATDKVPNDDRIIVVFPRHFSGRVVKGIEQHPKDCPGIYHEVNNCLECRSCWEW